MALLAPAIVSLAALVGGPPRVVVVVLDDVGLDLLDLTPTPNLDSIRAASAEFVVWTSPSCSPTRACMLTGQYGFRTGVGAVLPYTAVSGGLDPALETVADWAPGRSIMVGKWHLATPVTDYDHPMLCGFELFAGSSHNLGAPPSSSYFDWVKNVNGVAAHWTSYATTDTAQDAVRALRQLNGRLLFVSLNAAHKPAHTPPQALHTQGFPMTELGQTVAMLEAADTEIGSFLPWIGPEDWLIVFSDNGTADEVSAPPGRAKGSVYQGGIALPLWVRGPGVTPGRRSGLVDAVDLAPTVAELLGAAPPAGLDGQSFVPPLLDAQVPTARQYSYSERFGTGFRDRAMRDVAGLKLIRRDGFPDELFDLAQDPLELAPLPAVGPGFDALSAALTALSGP